MFSRHNLIEIQEETHCGDNVCQQLQSGQEHPQHLLQVYSTEDTNNADIDYVSANGSMETRTNSPSPVPTEIIPPSPPAVVEQLSKEELFQRFGIKQRDFAYEVRRIRKDIHASAPSVSIEVVRQSQDRLAGPGWIPLATYREMVRKRRQSSHISVSLQMVYGAQKRAADDGTDHGGKKRKIDTAIILTANL